MDPVVPFDPTVPLDYRKLGGEIPHQTPHQYSWLTTVCFIPILSKLKIFINNNLNQDNTVLKPSFCKGLWGDTYRRAYLYHRSSTCRL